jgi:hypothetical protein
MIAPLGLKGEAGENPALSRNCDAARQCLYWLHRLSQVARHCGPYYHLRAKGGRNDDEAVDSGPVCPTSVHLAVLECFKHSTQCRVLFYVRLIAHVATIITAWPAAAG